jgi:hypothetical protein
MRMLCLMSDVAEKSKGGRPRRADGYPGREACGVSRATWYRRDFQARRERRLAREKMKEAEHVEDA